MSESIMTNAPSIVQTLRDRFGASTYEFRGETSLILKTEQIVPACQILRDEYSFELLTEQTAVDYWPELAPRFHVVYRLRSLKNNLILGLRVPLEGTFPISAKHTSQLQSH